MYQWRLKPGKEQKFIDAWMRVTSHLQKTNPRISGKLLRTLQGQYLGLIEWPTEKDWESQNTHNIDSLAQQELISCVEELESFIPMECLKSLPALS
jgi:hypothetical protein